MGRHCFYCGKQLEPGETCDCRVAQENAKKRNQNNTNQAGTRETSSTSSASSSSSGSSTSSSQTASSRGSNQSTSSQSAKRNSRYQATQESREQHNSKKNNDKENKKAPGEDFFKSVFSRTKETNGETDSAGNERVKAKRESTDSPNFLETVKNIFTSPSQVIRDASYSSILVTFIMYFIAAALFALVMTVFFRNSNIISLIILQDSGLANNVIARETGNLLFRTFLIALLIAFARIGIYYLVIKFIGRQKVEFVSMFKIFLPGTYYELILLIVALLLANGTGMQGLVMLVAVLGIRAIIDTSSVRYHFSLSNDKLLLCSVVALTLTFVAISFLLNLAVPSIANFNVIPFDNRPFLPNA